MTDNNVDYAAWVASVVAKLEDLLGISTSDAQGFVESHEFELDNEWCKGTDAEGTAEQLAKLK